MKRAILVIAVVALAASAFWAGQRSARHDAPAAAAPAGGTNAAQPGAAGGRTVLYWQDPMYPQHRFDKPGKSPFMDMQLVPVYADDKAADGGVSVSAQTLQNLGVRFAPAEVAEMAQELRAAGYVQANERGIARAEVRSAGWVERLHVRAMNDPVSAGQVLAEIYSPELLAAQEEYLLARRMAQASAADAPLAQAARRRLELLGVPPQAIARLDAGGAAERRVPLVAPISGVVSELAVREGAMVQAGAAAFTITDLSTVWIAIEVPEASGALLRPGVSARATVRTLPGRSFSGRVDFVYPEVNAQTRTLRARVALANPGLALKPGMFADVQLGTAARKALTVPSEAVIQTGTRSVVIVADGGRFRPAQVKLGAEAQGRSEILAGLKAGEQVVVSGQFLIDSEAGLRGALQRLETPGEVPAQASQQAPGSLPPQAAGTPSPQADEHASHAPAAPALHKGTGAVTGIDAAKGRLELHHDAIASLKWPHMTMEFALRDKALAAGLKSGDRVEFELRGEPDKEGDYVIERLRRLP